MLTNILLIATQDDIKSSSSEIYLILVENLKTSFFQYFIESNRWNDPKSRLQQMCLTLRHADSRDPDMPGSSFFRICNFYALFFFRIQSPPVAGVH